MRVQMDQVVKFIVPDRILELIIPAPVQSRSFISIQRYFRTGRNYWSLTQSSSLCISLLCPIFNMQIKAEHCRKVRYPLMFSISACTCAATLALIPTTTTQQTLDLFYDIEKKAICHRNVIILKTGQTGDDMQHRTQTEIKPEPGCRVEEFNICGAHTFLGEPTEL